MMNSPKHNPIFCCWEWTWDYSLDSYIKVKGKVWSKYGKLKMVIGFKFFCILVYEPYICNRIITLYSFVIYFLCYHNLSAPYFSKLSFFLLKLLVQQWQMVQWIQVEMEEEKFENCLLVRESFYDTWYMKNWIVKLIF